MQGILQQLINGLVTGGVYALLAAGYTLIFGVLRLVYLAYGASIALGAYAGYAGIIYFNNLLLAVLLALVVGAVSGLAFDLVAVRYVRTSEHLIPLVSTIAIAAIIEEFLRLTVNGGLPVSYGKTALSGGFSFGRPGLSFQVGIAGVLAVGVSAVVLIGLTFLLRRTWVGRGIRCVAESKELATMLGIHVQRIYVITISLASLLAGLGGVLLGVSLPGIDPYFGEAMQFNVLAVVLFGGLGSVPGAVVGGLLLGLVQAFGSAYVSGTIATAFPFLLMIVVLLIRPKGLIPARQG